MSLQLCSAGSTNGLHHCDRHWHNYEFTVAPVLTPARLCLRQMETRQAALQKSSTGTELQALPAEIAGLTQRASALRQVRTLRPQQLGLCQLGPRASTLFICDMSACCTYKCSALLPRCVSTRGYWESERRR